MLTKICNAWLEKRCNSCLENMAKYQNLVEVFLSFLFYNKDFDIFNTKFSHYQKLCTKYEKKYAYYNNLLICLSPGRSY